MSFGKSDKYALSQYCDSQLEFETAMMDYEAGYEDALSDVKADVVLLNLDNNETIKISRKNLANLYKSINDILQVSEDTGEFYSYTIAKHILSRLKSIKE